MTIKEYEKAYEDYMARVEKLKISGLKSYAELGQELNIDAQLKDRRFNLLQDHVNSLEERLNDLNNLLPSKIFGAEARLKAELADLKAQLRAAFPTTNLK